MILFSISSWYVFVNYSLLPIKRRLCMHSVQHSLPRSNYVNLLWWLSFHGDCYYFYRNKILYCALTLGCFSIWYKWFGSTTWFQLLCRYMRTLKFLCLCLEYCQENGISYRSISIIINECVKGRALWWLRIIQILKMSKSKYLSIICKVEFKLLFQFCMLKWFISLHTN